MLFKVFQGKDGQYYFNILGANGEPLATSEGYTRKSDAVRGAGDLLQRVLTFNGSAESKGEDDPTVSRKPTTLPNIFDPGVA